MDKKKVLIIGCGKIGLSHLRAIRKIRPKLYIYLYDKDLKKINNIKNKNIFILKNLKQYNKFDLAIISTNSKERFKIFLDLVINNSVKKIIFEKFIYFEKYQFYKTIKILNQLKIKAWVNCLRREVEIFKKIKSQIKNEFKIFYGSSDWGLGCNSIHFLDLFAFFSKIKKIKCYSQNLNNKIYISKRKGYCEFKGSLMFNDGKSSLILEDNFKYKKKLFFIKTDEKKFSFNKSENVLTIKNLKTNSIKKYKSEKPYVSLLSYKIINKLLKNKKIELSSFQETVDHHKLLINLFHRHTKLINPNKKFMIT